MVWLLSAVVCIWLFVLLDSSVGMRKMDALHTVAPQINEEKVSVIIAARNEEQSIQNTIASLLQQTHTQLEIIVVNDRSTDETGRKIEEIAQQYAAVRSIHIQELPSGWLGKNHALYKGYEAATGEYLLFTDADIEFEPDTIRKALTYMKAENAGHLTVSPELYAKSIWLQSFVSYFIFGFGVFKKPWEANNDQKTMGGMGIGAFNLLTREVYEAIGTHETIRNRPDDDLQLGQVVKRNGHRQRLVTGLHDVKVEWYPSLAEAVKGLEKNTFAGFSYSLALTIGALLAIVITHLLPFVTIFSGDAAVQAVSAAAIAAAFMLYGVITVRMTTFPVWIVLLLPVATMIFIFSTIRAVSLTFIRGGVQWRGTFYSLKELRARKHL